ncbi:DUF2478 domain-containing protein [Rhizobium freirei]|uniref:DUF2478 domain-containing protein n=1 Tax=Rhizobium freirei TaxID=1353277 RepID=UPI0003A5AFFD
MRLDHSSYPITAIVYSKGSDFERFLRDTTKTMMDEGMRLAGLIQHSEPRSDRTKCDMYLRDLASDELYAISEDRGREARGCALDTDRLLVACEAVGESLSDRTDLLVLSKFGKVEVEGGGFRSLIVRAMELSVPALIGVPEINLVPFREFAAGFAKEIELLDLAGNWLTLQSIRARAIDCRNDGRHVRA